MNWLRTIYKNSFLYIFFEKRKMEKLRKKRIEEIKKRDPFIYK